MSGSDGGEVTPIECGNLGQTEAFGDGDHGCIGSAQREIGVLIDEFGHPPYVGWNQFDEIKISRRERSQERCLGARPGLALEEVAHFRQNGARDEDPAASQVQRGEQVDAIAMVFIVAERGGYQRAGVANDHRERPNPSANSSSTRVEVSVRRPGAMPNQAGGQDRLVIVVRCLRTSSRAEATCSSGSSSTSRRNSSRSPLTPSCYRGTARTSVTALTG